MKEYIITVLSVAVAAGLVEAFLPDRDGGTKSTVRFLTALCVIGVLISPASAFLKNISSTGESLSLMFSGKEGEEATEYYNEIFEQTAENVTAEAIKADVVKRLTDKFKIQAECLTVTVDVTHDGGGAYKIQKIEVRLSGTALLRDPYAIEDYLKTVYDCDADVR